MSLRGGSQSKSEAFAAFRAKLPPELQTEYDQVHAPERDVPTSLAPGWYPTKDNPVEGSVKVSLQYMKEFIKDTFSAYHIPLDKAEVAAEVLIEADRRGISSHGIGRLKPIYCDRFQP